MSAGILSLGTRRDATTFEKGCAGLGLKARLPIKKPNPTMAELESFFAGPARWLFFGGHFGGRTLSNEQGNVEIRFESDHVKATVDDAKAQLHKKGSAFRLHEDCVVVLWGGCSVCTDADTVRTLRTLFGEHVLLGFAGLTGWRMVDALLGGGFIKKEHFFDRLSPGKLEPAAIRDAWMRTARRGYGGGDLEGRFRAVDPDGQEWRLTGGKIVRGRKF